jgi:UDP-glucose 4-epimerase
MRILVTGASGFIGTALVPKLAAEGHQVAALIRRPHTFAAAPATRVSMLPISDIGDKAALSSAMLGVDAVFHLAGFTAVRAVPAMQSLYESTNRDGTQVLLDAMTDEADRTGRPLRLIFVSSTAVYGATEGAPVGEDHPPAPANRYGESKLAAEHAIRERTRQGAIGSVTLRACNLGGAANGVGDLDRSRLIPQVLRVAAGRSPHLVVNGSGGALREYLHIEDFLTACSLALASVRPTRSDHLPKGGIRPTNSTLRRPEDPEHARLAARALLPGANPRGRVVVPGSGEMTGDRRPGPRRPRHSPVPSARQTRDDAESMVAGRGDHRAAILGRRLRRQHTDRTQRTVDAGDMRFEGLRTDRHAGPDVLIGLPLEDVPQHQYLGATQFNLRRVRRGHCGPGFTTARFVHRSRDQDEQHGHVTRPPSAGKRAAPLIRRITQNNLDSRHTVRRIQHDLTLRLPPVGGNRDPDDLPHPISSRH